ncbi:MAG TPA: tetratricopeptide repeat protein [Terriglobales bacterium]|nr:tetratricopeptide repeat protein [Terriglobales bacterium]
MFAVACFAIVGGRFCAAQQNQYSNIVGQVSVARLGFPPKAIMVNLISRGATIGSVYTDNQGKFGFYSLLGGMYYLVIQDPDYEPINRQVDVDPTITQQNYVQVVLTPVERKGSDEGTAAVPGSNPNVIDLSQYTKRYPKKVMKEYQKGVEAERKKDVKGATEHLQKAMQTAPDFYPAHNELGRVYMGQSNFAAAEEQFQEAIKLNQTDPEAYLNLGNVYLLTHHYEQALKSVQEGLERNPQSALGKFLLGSVYERLGKMREAEQALQETLQLDPRMAKAHLELVNVYLAGKNQPEAIAQLKQFLKAAPNDPLAPRVKEVLKRLEKTPASVSR